MILCLRQH